jgi:hypothetical protein
MICRRHTTLLRVLSSGLRANQESTLSALEECISDVRAWLVSHKLMFKDSKTEFLVIGTPLKLDQ